MQMAGGSGVAVKTVEKNNTISPKGLVFDFPNENETLYHQSV